MSLLGIFELYATVIPLPELPTQINIDPILFICSYSYEYSKMSFELLETIQVTQNELPSKSASGILKNRSIYLYTVIYCPLLP